MSARLTVSDSKAKFHQEFKYVIPPLYRRIVDEFIVELNLLSNQNSFTEDKLFSLGLVRTYKELTKGYKPESQAKDLFHAICNSTGFDVERIYALEKELGDLINELNKEEIKDSLKDKEIAKKVFTNELGITTKNHYSRLTGIGLCKLIETIKGSELELKKVISEAVFIASAIGFNAARIEKDLNNYKNNTDKLNKMMDLIQINIEEEKKRVERKKLS